MAKPTIQVTPSELEELFIALKLWHKINGAHLTTEPIPERALPSHGYPAGTSDIIQHRNAAGYHVATTHRITMPDGSIPHWDEKDIHIGEIVIWIR